MPVAIFYLRHRTEVFVGFSAKLNIYGKIEYSCSYYNGGSGLVVKFLLCYAFSWKQENEAMKSADTSGLKKMERRNHLTRSRFPR